MSSNEKPISSDATEPVVGEQDTSALSKEALDNVSGGLMMASDYLTGHNTTFGGGGSSGGGLIAHESSHVRNQTGH